MNGPSFSHIFFSHLNLPPPQIYWPGSLAFKLNFSKINTLLNWLCKIRENSLRVIECIRNIPAPTRK